MFQRAHFLTRPPWARQDAPLTHASTFLQCSLQARSLPLQGWGLIDLLLRASNEGSLRPRVARAQKIIRLHPLRSLLFVRMNVDDLSRFIHFNRDLSADSDIPEHPALGSEAKTSLPSRRQQRHLGLAIINR